MPARTRRRVKAVSAHAAAASAPHSAEAAERPGRWSDTFTFVLALVGASIGFKTIWQFPYVASQNGGGAFLAIYVLLAFVFGAPLLIAQILIGRRAHASPVKAMSDLGSEVRGGRHWAVVGGIAVVVGLLIFSYLSVIAGWMIAYFLRAIFGVFSGLTADGVANLFAVFVKDPEKQIFWHTLFVAGVATIASFGMRKGVGTAVRWLVPVLYALLLALAVYAIQVGSFEDAAIYFFTPDFAKLTPISLVTAAAQAFFSLGLGTGVALMYGAYLKADASIPRAALTVVALDALTGVIAGVVVFAVLFGGSIGPASGPGLVFQALPLAFDHLPLGRWFGCLFFLLLVVIALVMGIGLLEPVIVWIEERLGFRRARATLLAAALAWVLGLATIFSFNYAAFSFKFTGVDIFSLTPLAIEKTLGAFDILQTATAEFMLPLGAAAMAIFAGWILPRYSTKADLDWRSPRMFSAWLWLLRVVVPAVLLLLLLTLHRL